MCIRDRPNTAPVTNAGRLKAVNLKSAVATGANSATHKTTNTLSPVSTGTMPKPMRNGCHARQANNTVCRQRLNGNTPPVATPAPHVTGGATLMRLADMRMLRTRQHKHRYLVHHLGRYINARMVLPIPLRWAASRPMHSD